MSENILGMERDTYHGFRVDHEPDHHVTNSYRDHWLNIFEAPNDRRPLFRVRMRVHWEYTIRVNPQAIRPGQGSAELARELGLRWVHGLIDTDRYERGRTHEEERTERWAADLKAREVFDFLRGLP